MDNRKIVKDSRGLTPPEQELEKWDIPTDEQLLKDYQDRESWQENQ